jgi:fructose-specific component phosphotransferase system IIB-like protein
MLDVGAVKAHMGTTLAMAAAKCAGQTRDGQCGR